MSTAQQAAGDSIRRQTEARNAYLEKHGLELSDAFEDLGVSAHKGRHRTHGALSRFLALVKSRHVGPGSILLIEDIDRLSREPVLQAFGLFSDLLMAGIKIVTLNNGWEITRESFERDNSQVFMIVGSIMRANEESKRKRELIGAAWASKRRRAATEKITSICPAWLRLDPTRGEFIAVPERVEVVREIFALATSGMGRYAIASYLNRRGVPVWVSGGRGWYAGYVGKILSSRAVLGEMQPKKLVEGRPVAEGPSVPAYYPAVIDGALFLRAQAAKKVGFGAAAGRRGKSFTNLFTGRCRCSTCGGSMTIRQPSKKQHGRARYLICSKAMRQHECSARHHFHYDKLERAILDNLPEFRLHELLQEPDPSAEHGEAEIAAYTLKIADLERRQSRYLDVLGEATEIDIPALRERLIAVAAEIKATQNARSALIDVQERRAAERAGRAFVNDHVRELREEAASADEPGRYAIRAKLATALASFIDFLDFDSTINVVTVILLGGARAYRFRDGELIDKAGVEPLIGTELGNIPPQAFTLGHAERARRLKQLLSTD